MSRSLFDTFAGNDLVHGTLCLDSHVIGLAQGGVKRLYGRITVLAVRFDLFQYGILRLLYLPGLVRHPSQGPDQCGYACRSRHGTRADGAQRGGSAGQSAAGSHLCGKQRLQDSFGSDDTAPGHQGTGHRTPARHAGGLHGRYDGPFLGKRSLADTACTQQPLHGTDRCRGRRLLADKAHGDTDIRQGSRHLEQPCRDNACKDKRLYPMEIAGHPRADIADHGEDVQQGIPDGYQAAGKFRSLEFRKEGTEHSADGGFQHLVCLHETFGQLGGHLRPQSLGRILLYQCQFGRNAL